MMKAIFERTWDSFQDMHPKERFLSIMIAIGTLIMALGCFPDQIMVTISTRSVEGLAVSTFVVNATTQIFVWSLGRFYRNPLMCLGAALAFLGCVIIVILYVYYRFFYPLDLPLLGELFVQPTSTTS